MSKVAALGLGVMGSGVAGSLLASGFTVAGYNRSAAKARPLVERGMEYAATPAEAAAGADCVIAMVADDVASCQVWLGPDGALARATPGTVLVELSTLSPGWVEELSGSAASVGCELIDAPVSGSRAAARDGALSLYVGGSEQALEAVRPFLEAISKAIIHLGPTGSGARWKLVNNLMAASQLAVLCEAVALARAAGLPMDRLPELFGVSPTLSPFLKAKLPRVLERNYADPDFTLRLMGKDVRYAVGLGESVNTSLSLGAATQRMFEAAVAKGLGDVELSAIAEAVGA